MGPKSFSEVTWISGDFLGKGALRIHIWYIYLPFVDFYGKCRYICNTWMVWGGDVPLNVDECCDS